MTAKGQKQRSYSAEFREQAVKDAFVMGLNKYSRLNGIPKSTVSTWAKAMGVTLIRSESPTAAATAAKQEQAALKDEQKKQVLQLIARNNLAIAQVKSTELSSTFHRPFKTFKKGVNGADIEYIAEEMPVDILSKNVKVIDDLVTTALNYDPIEVEDDDVPDQTEPTMNFMLEFFRFGEDDDPAAGGDDDN